MDLDQITNDILEERYPEVELTLDQQVQIVNRAGEILVLRRGEDLDDEVESLFLWLGGLNRDVMLYGIQLILRFYRNGIQVEILNKAQARINVVQDQLDHTTSYLAKDFQGINHYPWPVKYLDGTTFEDRLADLANEQDRISDEDILTVDMILSGMFHDVKTRVDHRYGLMWGCCYQLKEMLEGFGGKPNILFNEKMDHYFQWLLDVETELAIMGLRSCLAIFRLPVDHENIPSWNQLSNLIKPYLAGYLDS